MGEPTFGRFAAYAAFVMTIEAFFRVAMSSGLIGTDRVSNRTDVAYLFYLPFCTLFVSSDDLHRKCAPLFMRPDQEFVWGIDLKPALKSINVHFLKLPEEERDKGISAFAPVPPSGNLVAELWDRHLRPGYRTEKPESRDPARDAALVKRLKEFSEQPTLSGDVDPDETEMISVPHTVRHKRGSWWQLPRDYKEEAA